MKQVPCSADKIEEALQRGPRQSFHRYIEFLQEEYAGMMDKEQLTVLPTSLVKDIPGLSLSPLGLVLQHNRRDQMISDYSFCGVNNDTVPLAPPEAK